MGKYSASLPQMLPNQVYLTDGGLETVLIFQKGLDLPLFASCVLLRTEEGTAALRAYFSEMAQIANRSGVGFIVDTATWRANPDWTDELGLSREQFRDINRAAVQLALEIRDQWEQQIPMPVAGVLGPRGDGYRPDQLQSVEEARAYSLDQVAVLADAGVDFISALTMNYPAEGAGIALAARDAGLPVAISFTVETDGKLATGESLMDAIAFVDDATDSSPAYYMVNCAHPSHLPADLSSGDPWTLRVKGYRANASQRSHAELNEAEELDDGDFTQLGFQIGQLHASVPQLTVLGGCCGTDKRHIEAIASAVA